jgi:hypothetical protein
LNHCHEIVHRQTTMILAALLASTAVAPTDAATADGQTGCVEQRFPTIARNHSDGVHRHRPAAGTNGAAIHIRIDTDTTYTRSLDGLLSKCGHDVGGPLYLPRMACSLEEIMHTLRLIGTDDSCDSLQAEIQLEVRLHDVVVAMPALFV